MTSSQRRRIPFWVLGLLASAVPALVTVAIWTSEFTVHSAGSGAYTDSQTLRPSNMVLIVGLALSVVLGVGVGAWVASRRARANSAGGTRR